MTYINLIAIGVLLSTAISCGDAGGTNPRPDQKYKVTCYSGGQKVLELPDVQVHRDYYSGGVTTKYVTNGKTYTFVNFPCIEEK